MQVLYLCETDSVLCLKHTASAPDSLGPLSWKRTFLWLANLRKPTEGQCLYFMADYFKKAEKETSFGRI